MSEPETARTASWPIYRRLLGYARPYRWILIGAFIAMALDAASFALFTRLLEPMLDDGLVARDLEVIRWLPWAVIALIGGRAIASFCAQYGIAAVGRSVVRDLRRAVFHQYLQMPAAYFDARPSGRLVARLTFNIEQVAQACTTALTVLVRDTLIVLFLLGVMFYYAPLLSLGVLVVGPLIGAVIAFVSRRFRRYGERIQDSMGDVTQIAEELVDGHRVVKVYGGEAQEKDAFDRANQFNRRQNLKMTATQSVSSGFVQMAAGLALAAIIYVATGPVGAERFSAGSFSAYMFAMLGILPSLRRLTNVHSIIQTGVAGADSVFAVLDEPAEDAGGQVVPDDIRGEIAFEDVSLRYAGADHDALSGITFTMPAGSVTALVGESGGGKSSVANLIPRFYQPTDGRITLDGVSLNELPVSRLREAIAIVSQDIVLFNDSVANNIAYGALAGADDAAVKEAARRAHALDFIHDLPQGFDTPVGERGARLSGGQRQRVAIARALLKDAPLLILDEATSALDSESERQIQAALEEVMADRTTLVIAHRLSTIRRADQLIVIDQGSIVEQGTHDELLALDGHYARFYRLQNRDDD